MSDARRGRRWLAAGAAAGLALAAAGTLAPARRSNALAPGEAARVNGVPIAAAQLGLALERLDADRRGGVQADERGRVLERLIDEELLVQRGAALGLIESDPSARAALVQAVVASVLADAASTKPDDAELAAFFGENRRYFARPGRVRVSEIRLRDGPEAGARADAALAALAAGESFASVRARLADRAPLALPDALLPEAKLRELLGPTLASAALALEPGAHTPVLPAQGGSVILSLLEREPERLPELDEVRAEVEAEWTRRAGERALASYLSQLRREAEIARAPAGP